MGGFLWSGDALELATRSAELGVQWLAQSTLLIAVGLLAAALVRRRHPAMRSAVYQTTLVAVLAAPLVAYALSTAGWTFVALELPAPRFEVEELVVVEPELERPAGNLELASGEYEANSPAEALAEADLEGTQRLESPHSITLDAAGDPVTEGPIAADRTIGPQPQVAVTPPPVSIPSAPAESNVRRVIKTDWRLAALWVGIPLVWCGIALLLLARLVRDHWQMVWLGRQAVAVDDATLDLATELAASMSVALPRLRRTPLVSSPCLCGLLRPTILLPEEIAPAALSAVLVHELAHRKRNDCWWNLLRHVLVAVLWPQPLAWILSRRIEAVAEDLCDDYVVQYGACRATYAETLLSIAERNWLASSGAAVSLVTFRSLLGQRVQRILDGSRRLTLTVGLAALSAVALGGATAALMAGLVGPRVPVAVAQEPAAKVNAPSDANATAPKEEEPGQRDEQSEAARTPATAAVRGVVLDANGKPAPAVRLRAFAMNLKQLASDTDDAWQPIESAELTTDAAGRFRIDLPQTAVEVANWPELLPLAIVVAEREGSGPGWAMLKKNEIGEVTLRLVADKPITGRIVDLQGQPVAGAVVELGSIETNAEENLEPWLAALRAGQPDRIANQKHPYPRKRLGNLRYGKPTRRFLSATATTGADGRFRLASIGRGRYATLHLSGPGIVTSNLRVVAEPMQPILPNKSNARLPDQTIYGSDFQHVAAASAPIEGIVRDAETKQPLAGVRVVSEHFAGTNLIGHYITDTYSDAQGRYRLLGMPVGKGNRILAMPSDELPYLMREFDVPEPQGFEAVSLDLELQRGVFIEGTVLDADTGAPVVGELFYLPWPDHPLLEKLPEFGRKRLPGPQGHYRTNAHGLYRIVGLPGRGVVTFHREMDPTGSGSYPPGQGLESIKDLPSEDAFRKISALFSPRSSVTTAVREVNAEENQTFKADFELRQGGRVKLRPVDAEGQPIEGVTAAGLRPSGQFHAPNEKLGSVVEVAGLGPGERRVVVLQHESLGLAKAVTIEAEQAAAQSLEVKLEPYATLTARLVNDDEPVRNAAIEFRYQENKGFLNHTSQAATDDSGRFVQSRLVPGLEYDVVETQSYKSLATKLTAAAGEMIDLGEIDLRTKERPQPKRTPAVPPVGAKVDVKKRATPEKMLVRGVVLDPQGKPLPDAEVMVWHLATVKEWAGTDVPKMKGKSDAAGRFEIEVAQVLAEGIRAGRPWPLAGAGARHADFAPGRAQTKMDTRLDGIEIRLGEFAPIEGRIVNPEGQPVAGVKVRLRQINATLNDDLQPWLEQLRRGIVPGKMDPAIRPDFGYGDWDDRNRDLAVTDADGRFRVDRVGKNRVALFELSGGGIVTSQVSAANTPTGAIDLGQVRLWTDSPMLYGSTFQYVAEPAQPIAGLVRDAETGQPIAGMKITSQRFANSNYWGNDRVTSVSDEQGRYRLDGMPHGAGNLILASGDLPYLAQQFEVPQGRELETIDFDLRMHRGVQIEGRVLDSQTGKPVAAKVIYIPWFDNPLIDKFPEYQGSGLPGVDPLMAPNTDAEGRFKLVGIPGRGLLSVVHTESPTYPVGQGFEKLPELRQAADKFRDLAQLYAPGPEYTIAVEELKIPEDATSIQQDIKLTAGRTVELSLVDGGGKPVEVTQVVGMVSRHWVQTHKDLGSTIKISGLMPGEVRPVMVMNVPKKLGTLVEVAYPDREGGQQSATLAPLATITGRLVNQAGEPLAMKTPRSEVQLQARYGQRMLNPYTAVRDEQGRFELLAVAAPVDYDLYSTDVVGKGGKLAEKLRVTAGEMIDLGTIDDKSEKRPPIKRTPMASRNSEVTRAIIAQADESAGANSSEITFAGKVLAPNGRPQGGAEVTLEYFHEGQRKLAPTVKSADDGSFTVRIANSEISADESLGARILATSPGLGLAWSSAVSFETSGKMLAAAKEEWNYPRMEKGAQNRTLRLVEDEPITGRVMDLEGRGIAGAVVRPRSLQASRSEGLDKWLAEVKTGKLNSDSIGRYFQEWLSLGSRELPGIDNAVTTDAEGRFRLAGFGRGRLLQVAISADGLETSIQRIATHRGEPVQLTVRSFEPAGEQETVHAAELTVSLAPSQTVEGVVRDADTGQPVAGVRVVPDSIAGKSLSGVSAYDYLETITDAEGRYQLKGLPLGRNELAVVPGEDSQYLVSSLRVETTPKTPSTKLDFQLKQGVVIEGRVTDSATGKPVRGFVEYFAFYPNPHLESVPGLLRAQGDRVRTDKEGHYRIIGLPGRGIVTVLATGVDHDYPRGIGAEAIDGDKPSSTGIRGADAFKLFSTRPYHAISGNASYLAEVNPEPDAKNLTLDMSLTPRPRRPLELVDAENRPLTGLRPPAEFDLKVAGLNLPGNWENVRSDKLFVRTLLPDEERRIYVYVPDRQLAGNALARGSELGPLQIKLAPSATISGRVLTEDGEPAANLTVRTHHSETAQGVFPGNYDEYVTDAEGRFSVAGLAPGLSYSLRVYRGGNIQRGELVQDVPLAAGETKDLGDLTIRPVSN